MPEGDTVHRAARRLHRALAGRVLTAADLRVPRYATVDLTGLRVEEVAARGKHLLLRAGGPAPGSAAGTGRTTLHSHLKMEGRWDLYRPGERWRRPAHTARAVLEVDGAVAVGFDLGVLEVFPTAAEAERLPPLGPDPLGPDWDADGAAANLGADPDRPIGLALLDQALVAGFGNVYRNELCFLRGRHPRTPARECGDLTAWAALGARLLRANADRAVRSTTGDTRPGRRAWVYGRDRRPCLRCGTVVERGVLDGPGEYERAVWWCPACQPGPLD